MIRSLRLPSTTGREAALEPQRLEPQSLREIVDDLAAQPGLWRGRVRHSDQREYELLWRDDRVEVWLICWNGAGHDTGFHDHDVSAGAFAVVEGALIEERLAVGLGPTRRLSRGASVCFSPAHVHRVRGVGDIRAVSIHAYSPPLRRLGVYAVTDDGALARESVAAGSELAAQPSTPRPIEVPA